MGEAATIKLGEVVQLYDPEEGYAYGKYVYTLECSQRCKHVFTPEDDNRAAIRHANLLDVFKRNDPLDARGHLLAPHLYTDVSSASCYRFNSLLFPAAVIIAMTAIIAPHGRVGENERERNDAIHGAVMLPPIDVQLMDDGRYKIVNGKHRFLFSEGKGHANIPAIIKR
jgi:hypothetical protein